MQLFFKIAFINKTQLLHRLLTVQVPQPYFTYWTEQYLYYLQYWLLTLAIQYLIHCLQYGLLTLLIPEYSTYNTSLHRLLIVQLLDLHRYVWLQKVWFISHCGHK